MLTSWRDNLDNASSFSGLPDAGDVLQHILKFLDCWMENWCFWDCVDDTLLINQGFPQCLHILESCQHKDHASMKLATWKTCGVDATCKRSKNFLRAVHKMCVVKLRVDKQSTQQ